MSERTARKLYLRIVSWMALRSVSIRYPSDTEDVVLRLSPTSTNFRSVQSPRDVCIGDWKQQTLPSIAPGALGATPGALGATPGALGADGETRDAGRITSAFSGEAPPEVWPSIMGLVSMLVPAIWVRTSSAESSIG